jgi:hypothetical protein
MMSIAGQAGVANGSCAIITEPVGMDDTEDWLEAEIISCGRPPSA